MKLTVEATYQMPEPYPTAGLQRTGFREDLKHLEKMLMRNHFNTEVKSGTNGRFKVILHTVNADVLGAAAGMVESVVGNVILSMQGIGGKMPQLAELKVRVD